MKGDKSFGPRLFGLVVFVHILSIAISLSVFARDFAAVTIKNEIDLSVIEVTGDFDMDTQEGREAQKIVAGEFYNTHPDDYDFLVIFTEFEIQMPTILIDGEQLTAAGFYSPIRNDIQGIGEEIFDYSFRYGSNGNLQGIINIGCINQKTTDPLDPEFKDTMRLLSHELLHRWSGRVNFIDIDGSTSDALLGYRSEGGERAHWSFLFDTDGSVLYGNEWYDNGNGTFTAIAARKYYSQLDMYLMGLIDKSEVPPMLLIENENESREQLPMAGVTIEGTAQYVSIDDIIAAEGERIPDWKSSQKKFKIGVLLLTRSGLFQESEVHEVQTIIRQWTMWLSALTDGRAIIYYDGIGENDLPDNPGTELPPVDPRDVPAEIEGGVSWLMANQKEDGYWNDVTSSSVRDTVAVIHALNNFTEASQHVLNGATWLGTISTASLDHLSKKAGVMSVSGNDISSLVTEIIEKQNSDGGWGNGRFYLSNSLDTAIVLEGLAAAGYADSAAIRPAMAYLKGRQNIDGGWGIDDGVSSIQTTASVLSAFSNYLNILNVEEQVQEGLAWLQNRQIGDGGFGNESSSVYNTAEALIILKKFDAPFHIINNALNYLKDNQSKNGSWHESTYQTALAVSAMWAAMRETDLFLSTGDISITPETITQLPADIQVNATVRNLGLTGVEQVIVALYDGGIAEDEKVSEQIVSVGGNSSVELTFTVTITDGNSHLLFIVIDPEGLLTEAGTLNNTALKIVYPEGTKDFEILESDLIVFPTVADMLEPVSIAATIHNNGTNDAFAVPVKFSVESGGESYLIAIANLDIPAGGYVSHELTWNANRSGDDLSISVQADPNNSTSELSEGNNKVYIPIVVNSSTKANLTLSYQDITFYSNPANEGGSVDISAVIRNNGASAAENFQVLFYDGVPDTGGEIIGTQTVAVLSAGESITVVNQWAHIDACSETVIYIQIDPENQIDEIDENDNSNFEYLEIIGLPDLFILPGSIGFNPGAPKEGDPVNIVITVQNSGAQSAESVLVEVEEGGDIIFTGVIPSIPGNSNADISFSYDTTGKSGAYTIRAVLDPGNLIQEKEEGNNAAERTIGVQDGSLWLTERYFSPNSDSIKDFTQFFFTLPMVQTVQIEIMDKDGKVVRTFSGDEHENILNGMVTWDGMDENGSVVPDGDYQLNVFDTNGVLITALVVAVDNNRSLLYEAIGTKYWFDAGPIEMLSMTKWQWLPDDTGFICHMVEPNANRPEYPTGIYFVTNLGDDVQRIVPVEWSIGNDPDYDYHYKHNQCECSGDQIGFEISPDGQQVAIILEKYNKFSKQVEVNQLWVVDRYGETMLLIDSYDVNAGGYWEINDIFWSRDSSRIAFKLFDQNTGLHKIVMQNIDGAERIEVIPNWGADTGWKQVLAWAPDNTRLAYASESNIVLVNSEGESNDILSIKSPYVFIDWLDENKILIRDQLPDSGNLDIWIVDPDGQSVPVIVDSDVRDARVSFVAEPRCQPGMSGSDFSPQGGLFTYAVDFDPPNPPNTVWYNDWEIIKVCDKDGVCHDAHQIGLYSQMFWSPDAKNIVISESYMTTHLSIHDVNTFQTLLWTYDGFDNDVPPYELPDYYVSMDSPPPALLSYYSNTTDARGISQWVDNRALIAHEPASWGLGVFNIDTFEFDPLPLEASDTLLSPGGDYLGYSSGYGYGVLTHLLNLSAYLKISKEESSISIMGVATDLNFSQYKLEYASVEAPDEWHLVCPPSDASSVNWDEPIAQWAPPNEGVFYIRLTVTDKAGNSNWVRKRITWNDDQAVLTNLFLSEDLFSPNEDGLQDTFSLNYSVTEPVHLEFRIFNGEGASVRAIAVNHSIPGDYSISWDGRDESGKIVSDGLYKIATNGYEFFFQVDNTVPEAGIRFSQIKPVNGNLVIELSACNQDQNLKHWTIEYGNGDNPIEWFEYKSGEKQLGLESKDKFESVAILTQANLPFLKDKKFRIRVEDEAGNINSSETVFFDEVLVLQQWQDTQTGAYQPVQLERKINTFIIKRNEDGDLLTLPEAYAYPGLHRMIVTETHNLPLTELTLQYRIAGDCESMEWYDSPITYDSLSGTMVLEWDSSYTSSAGQIRKVRIKAIDGAGELFYTNECVFQDDGGETACPLSISRNCSPENLFSPPHFNNPYDDLISLRFGFKTSFSEQWTYYEDYQIREGDTIPVGHYPLPLPDGLVDGEAFEFIVIGENAAGKEYSDEGYFEYPWEPCYDISINYHYEEGDAYNYYSSGIAEVYFDENEVFNEIPVSDCRTIKCFIDENDDKRLIGSAEVVSKETMMRMSVDTSNIHEGRYNITLVLEYYAGGQTLELSGSRSFVVDRSLPDSIIAYPSHLSQVCPDEIFDKDGNYIGLGISVTALAADTFGIERYELYWGSIEFPDQLSHATSAQGHYYYIDMNSAPFYDFVQSEKSKYSVIVKGPTNGTEKIAVVSASNGHHSLTLKAVDSAGNVNFYTTTFDLNNPKISINPNVTIFSPNSDGVSDEVQLEYSIDSPAQVTVEVFKEQAVVRSMVQNEWYQAGTEILNWDGCDNSGAVVSDGLYRIRATAKDSCENASESLCEIFVDNTPPTAVITFPQPGGILTNNLVEISGTAFDPHFKSYHLEVQEVDASQTVTLVSENHIAVENDLLGNWNTFGSVGSWNIKLQAVDDVGNVVETTTTVQLGDRGSMIRDLVAEPTLISPNSDLRFDAATIRYYINETCNVKLEIMGLNGALIKQLTEQTVYPGWSTFEWDGKAEDDTIVADGTYKVSLSAVHPSNPSVEQEESVTIYVDTTPPEIVLQDPANICMAEILKVKGKITDTNIEIYTVILTGASGTVEIDSAYINRVDHSFGELPELSEGEYTLTAWARDKGQNETSVSLPIIVDRAPPAISLSDPSDNEVFGSEKNIVSVTGAIDEINLDIWSIKFASDEDPDQWTLLFEGADLPDQETMFEWPVGGDSGLADGHYTLSVFVKDCAGWETEQTKQITFDNTPPVVELTFPEEGGYVKGPFDITGKALDLTLEEYKVELAEGPAGIDPKWSTIKRSSDTIEDGILASLNLLPEDGVYRLNLTASDKAGSKSQQQISFTIDTSPPSAPQLTGQKQNEEEYLLSWTQNTESDLAGCNLYRNGQKINAELLTATTYVESSSLDDGEYTYTVKAVDFAGWESELSNSVIFDKDNKGPDASIIYPREEMPLSDYIDIIGIAYSDEDFKEYRLFSGELNDAEEPVTWDLIKQSPVPVQNGILARWDMMGLSEGNYAIRLEAEDLNGNIDYDRVNIRIDSTPPAPPVFLSATADGDVVTLIWQENSEQDLAGYLVYRNYHLVNSDAEFDTNLKQYLVSDTTYIDSDVPDGEFTYHLEAMDNAGNLSAQSNQFTVTIDTRTPIATIIIPENGHRFDRELLIKAESLDQDIINLQFQYKAEAGSVWVDLGPGFQSRPFITYFDPVELGFELGNYQLRAVATDAGGKTDTSPQEITIIYEDVTAPKAPEELQGIATGGDVSFSWTTNSEPDLAGYNLYRVNSSSRTKLNTDLILDAVYTISSLDDSSYTFEVTAVDTVGNESDASDSASVTIYTPELSQPYTPSMEDYILLTGSALPGANIEILKDTGTVLTPLGTVVSDDDGKFEFTANLLLGENVFVIRATDEMGNTSKPSEPIMVVFNTKPEPPEGFTADSNTTLVWDPNSEEDIFGYNIYLNGAKVNVRSPLTNGTYTSSGYYPSRAFDSNTSTYVTLYASGWWEIEFDDYELISRVDLRWYGYPAEKFQIQAWTGYAWIALFEEEENTSWSNSYEFDIPYGTLKLRVNVLEHQPDAYYSRLAEVGLQKENVIPQPLYNAGEILDGNSLYQVSAIDRYGSESPLAQEMLPEPPEGISTEVTGDNVVLTWDAKSETNIAGCNVFEESDGIAAKLNTSVIGLNEFHLNDVIIGNHIYRLSAVTFTGVESLLSGPVIAGITPDPNQETVPVIISVIPGGESLEICWEEPGGDVSGYNLYRASSVDGQYTMVNDELITGTCFTDQGLVNDTTYYYLLAYVDSIGDQQVCSETVTGEPADGVAPSPPLLTSPVAGGGAVELGTTPVDISGIADPGSQVSLYEYNTIVYSTNAGMGAMTSLTDLGGGWGYDLSPDGGALAYSYWDNTYTIGLKDVSTGGISSILADADAPKWSPDGTKLLYTDYSEGSSRTGVYEIDSGNAYLLNEGSTYSEYDPVWAPDSQYIVYVSRGDGSYLNIWKYNLTSETSEKLTEYSNANSPEVSHDGNHVAYTDNGFKYVDITGGQIISVDTGTYAPSSYEWSPTDDLLAYVSYQNGSSQLYTLDIASGTVTQLTHYSGSIDDFQWSSTGSYIIAYGNNGSKQEVLMTSPNGPGKENVVYRQEGYWSGLELSSTGEIFVYSEGQLFSIVPDGCFTFKNVVLNFGENRFYARTMDASGNTSEPSDAITLILDQTIMADIKVAAKNIFFYPSAPLSGDDVIVTATVENSGAVDMEDITVEVYAVGPEGSTEYIATENFPYMVIGSEETISALWATSNKSGKYKIVCEAYPRVATKEASSNNNRAIRDVFVALDEGLDLSVTLGSNQCGPREDLHVRAELFNSGSDQLTHLDIRVLDENNVIVKELESDDVILRYGTISQFDYVWNTGVTYSGNYAVEAVLSETTGPIVSQHLPFSITADAGLMAVLTTNKSAYGSNEDVWMTVGLTNTGLNYNYPVLSLNVRITDENGSECFSEDIPVNGLSASDSIRLETTWNTERNQEGTYHATATIVFDGGTSLQRSKTFSIEPSNVLQGSLSIMPLVVAPGNGLEVSCELRHPGNAAVSDIPVQVLILDPDQQSVVGSEQRTVSIDPDETYSEEIVFLTTGLSLKTYRVILQYEEAGEMKSIATASFSVRDIFGPSVTILSPEDGVVYGGNLSMSVIASDDATGVSRVEYRIDHGDWIIMPAADPAAGRYSAFWLPTQADAGPHTVEFQAYDGAGNVSPVESVDVIIELTSAFKELVGNAAAEPNPVYQGQSVDFSYTISNNRAGDINDLVVTLIITDPDTGDLIESVEEAHAIGGNSEITGAFQIPTPDILPGVYSAELQVKTTAGDGPRSLSSLLLEVYPSLRAEPVEPNPVNLLVWVNDTCGNGQGNNGNGSGCIQVGLLTQILDDAVTDYILVTERDEFEDALRSPYYTDILILGDQYPLTGHLDQELMEKVNSGTGLITSLWRPNGLDDAFLGMKYKGKLSDSSPVLRFDESDITVESSITGTGKPQKIEILDDALVVGWAISGNGNSNKEYPALVLSDYGQGHTIYCAFDLGLSLYDDTYDILSQILKSAIGHVHAESTESSVYAPMRFVSRGFDLSCPGGSVHGRIKESFPPPLKLYDAGTGSWVMEGPWLFDIDMEEGASYPLLYYYLTPDVPGTYTVETEISVIRDEVHTVLNLLSDEVVVEKDRSAYIDAIIDMLDNLTLSNPDRSKASNAAREIEKLRDIGILTTEGMESRIHCIIKAVEQVLKIDSADISEIRTEMDILLRIEQGTFYYLVYPIEG